MRPLFLAFAALALPLAACADEVAPPSTIGAPDSLPTDRAGYVAMAGSSDLYEIQSSQLALSQSRRDDVRALAQMLIRDHTQTTGQVMAAAQASGMSPPPPMLLPPQVTMMTELQRADSGNFDQVYLGQQVTAHQMALALHDNYAHRGDAPPLRNVAATAVPIIRQHLAHVQMLRR